MIVQIIKMRSFAKMKGQTPASNPAFVTTFEDIQIPKQMKFIPLLQKLHWCCWAIGLFSCPIMAQTNFSSALPIFRITTQNGANIINEPKVSATLEVVDNGTGRRNQVSDRATQTLTIGIETRGSSSQDLFPKKPYGFETRDSKGENLNVSILGLPAENDWVLNSVHNDKTMLRDVLAYDLFRRMGRYATRFRFVEVLVNNEYLGVYALMEKIKVDKARVNITKMKNTDNSGDAMTGGFILKIDKTTGSSSRMFQSVVANNNYPNIGDNRIWYQIHYPDIKDLTQAQFEYIRQFMTTFDNALNRNDYLRPDAEYRKLADLESFADYFLLTELTRNVDGYRLSTFFYKDRDSKNGKLVMGPAWDYNLGFGNADYYDGWRTNGWVYELPDTPAGQQDYFKHPFWFRRLLRDSSYTNTIGQRWRALRRGVLSTQRIHQWIDSTAATINEAQGRNEQKWRIMGRKLWPNYYVGTTYTDEINWLKDWVRNRLTFMDGGFANYGIVLGEEKLTAEVPLQCYPNPAQDWMMIKFNVSQKAQVLVTLSDLQGRLVQTIAQGELPAGEHEAPINAPPSGEYVVNFWQNSIPLAIQKVRVVR
jgi:CotH kinase protein